MKTQTMRCIACSAPSQDASPEQPFCPDHASEDAAAWQATSQWHRRHDEVRAAILRHNLEAKA